MAQTVSQPQKKKSVQVAESATLDCTYDTSDTNYLLFWYKQQGGQVTLVILQEAYKQYNATLNRFSVNFQKAAKSFSLEISDSQLGDAATYFCALMERHGDTGNREGLTETSDLSICADMEEVAGVTEEKNHQLFFGVNATLLQLQETRERAIFGL